MGAIWPLGVERGTGVGVGVGVAGRRGVCGFCTVRVVGEGGGAGVLCCGASVVLRRGRESCVRAADTKVDPIRLAIVNASASTTANR